MFDFDQGLEQSFSSILETLRSSWDSANAANVLLSLIFYKRLLALEQEGALDLVHWEEENLLQQAQAYLQTDERQALRYLSSTLLQAAQRNPALQNVFYPLLQALEEEENLQPLAKVLRDLEHLDFSTNQFSPLAFGQFFQNTLYQASFHSGKHGEQWTTPRSLNQLLAALARPQAGEWVYEPAAGQGGTILALVDRCPDLRFIAQEKDLSTWSWCKMNLLMNGVENLALRQEDSLLAPPHEAGSWADLAVANFPFGLHVPTHLVRQQPYLFLPFDVKSTPELGGISLFMQLMLHQLKDTGRMFVILPISVLYKERQDRRLREYLLMHDWVEAVISLPYGLLYSTGSPICIVAINKQKAKHRQGRILFINATQLLKNGGSKLHRALSPEHIHCIAEAFHRGEELEEDCNNPLSDCVEMVPLVQIMAQQYNLNAKRYASPFIKQLKRLELSYPVVQLSEVFEYDPPYVWFDASFQRHFSYVQPQDLGVSFAEYQLQVDKLLNTREMETVEGRLVMQSVLLVGKKGQELRMGYFEYQGEPIVVHEDIMVFSINEDKVHLEYLLLQMYSPLFIDQMQVYKSDNEEHSITEREFVQLQIILPERYLQEKETRETKVRLLREEELKVERLRHRLNLGKQKAQNEQNKIISSLQHELGNRLPAALAEFRNLKMFLADKIEDQSPVRWDDPIFPLLEGEDPLSVDSLRTILQRMESLLKYSISTVDAAGDIIKADRSKLRLERILFKDLLLELKNIYHNETQFSIQIDVEEDENGNEQAIYVNLDRGQMMAALTNLIDNAKKHGFTEQKKYLVRFHLGLSPDKKEVILLYKNDGNPFPESFSFDDFVAYGNYAGETGHSGIGGYLIQQIIDNHEGSLSWLEDIPKNDPFKVQFEVVLPVG